MSPQNKFYEVSVKMNFEDNKGRVKKEVKKYLIDAADTNQAEKNTMKLLEGTMFDWEIVGINLSKICEIYMNNLED